MNFLTNALTRNAPNSIGYFDTLEERDFDHIENLENYPPMPSDLIAQCRQMKDLAIHEQKVLAAKLLNEFYKIWNYDSFKDYNCLALEGMQEAFHNFYTSKLISNFGISNTLTLLIGSYQLLFLLSFLGEESERQKFGKLRDLFKEELLLFKKIFPEDWKKQIIHRCQLRTSFPNIHVNSVWIAKKVFKIACALLLATDCVMLKSNINPLVQRAYKASRSHKGWLAFMFFTYIVLKSLCYLNQKQENQKIPTARHVFIWLKNIPVNFLIGAKKVPKMIAQSLTISFLTITVFEWLSINTVSHLNFIKEESLLEIAFKKPLLEELFFREFLQGSLDSTMTLVNVVARRMGRGTVFAPETIQTSSRFISSALFGVGHAHQCPIQAITAGAASYFYFSWVYEKNGLAASFGLHCANNFFAGSLIKWIDPPPS